MTITSDTFAEAWLAPLPLQARYLWLYLNAIASKAGIFALDIDAIKGAMGGAEISAVSLFESFGGRVKPLDDRHGIIVDYIRRQWLKGGYAVEFSPERVPLHKGIAAELSRHGLAYGDLCGMAKQFTTPRAAPCFTIETKGADKAEREVDDTAWVDSAFKEFWAAYPSSCPRKVDKKKCAARYAVIMRGASDKGAMQTAILRGLTQWKGSAIWSDPQYVKAPLVWLNGNCWEDTPKGANGINRQRVRQAENAIVDDGASSGNAELF